MGSEVKYFTQDDWHSEYLPPISWEEMLDKGSVIAPTTLIHILSDAKRFLVNEPGPNLLRRKLDAPTWFHFWEELMLKHSIIAEDTPVAVPKHSYLWHQGLKPFEKVSEYVKSRGFISGLNLMGEGAGREGHIFTYETMRRRLGKPSTVVWAFEQPAYFEYKERPAPFLPLIVRLSMAIYLGVDVATVLPLPPTNATSEQLSAHYLKLFKELGIDYHFADIADPHALEKVARGRTDIDTLIPHMNFSSTSEGVKRLLGVDEIQNSLRRAKFPREPIFPEDEEDGILNLLIGEIGILADNKVGNGIFGAYMNLA